MGLERLNLCNSSTQQEEAMVYKCPLNHHGFLSRRAEDSRSCHKRVVFEGISREELICFTWSRDVSRKTQLPWGQFTWVIVHFLVVFFFFNRQDDNILTDQLILDDNNRQMGQQMLIDSGRQCNSHRSRVNPPGDQDQTTISSFCNR